MPARAALAVVPALLAAAIVSTAVRAAEPAAAVRPVIGVPTTVPAVPVAGGRLVVSFPVRRSDNGKPLTRGTMSCEPAADAKPIAHVESFVGGLARVSFVVPRSASAVRVRLTISVGARSATRVAILDVPQRLPALVSVADASTTEGNSGTTSLAFRVTLSAASRRTVSVRYATVPGSASPGADYVPAAGTLSFRPGSTAATVGIVVKGDTAVEQDETLALNLSRPANAALGESRATGTILDDDGLQYRLELAGPEELVYDSSTQRCALFDVADLPARAVRSADGEVQLYLAGGDNRRLVGPDLDRLRHDCTPALPSHMNDDPAAYDDMEWIAAPYTTDGRTVYALVHMERHAGTAGAPPGYDALTLAVSSDGGRTFRHAAPPGQLAVSIPDRAGADLGRGPYGWQGVGGPSNIVHGPDGYWYAFALVNRSVTPRSEGTCLLRTDDLANPRAWRGWNHRVGWNVTFVDPYRDVVSDPAAHVCEQDPALAAATRGGFQAESLTFNTSLGAYVLVGEAGDYGLAPGFYTTASFDLRRWTPMRLVAPEPLIWSHGCKDDDVQYPSLLDPRSSSPSFETTGETAYLYYQRTRWTDSCAMTWDRDLVRVPVRFTRQQ